MQADDPLETGGHAGYLRPGAELAGGRYQVDLLLGVWGIRALYAVTESASGTAAMAAEFVLTNRADIQGQVRHLVDLEHPILPIIREFAVRDRFLYLVLTLAAGTTLDRALAAEATGRVDERQVIAWGLQLADGLAFLHGQRPPLVVADLAPSAVLITPYNRLKLVGLGALLGLYSTAETVGALEPGYAAPEVYQGHVDGQGDLYAAGALLHRALSGSNPAVHAPGLLPPLPSLRPGIVPELSDAITRAVAPLPEDRWPDAASFAAALRQAEAALDLAEQTAAVHAASTEQAQAASPDATTPPASAENVQAPELGASAARGEASASEADSLPPFAADLADVPEDWPEPTAERELTPIPHAFMPPPDLSLLKAAPDDDVAPASPASGVPTAQVLSTEEPGTALQAAEVPSTAAPADEPRAGSQPDLDESVAPAAVIAAPAVAEASPAPASAVSAARQPRPGVLGRLFGRRSSR